MRQSRKWFVKARTKHLNTKHATVTCLMVFRSKEGSKDQFKQRAANKRSTSHFRRTTNTFIQTLIKAILQQYENKYESRSLRTHAKTSLWPLTTSTHKKRIANGRKISGRDLLNRFTRSIHFYVRTWNLDKRDRSATRDVIPGPVVDA